MDESLIPPQLRRIRTRKGLTLGGVSSRCGLSEQHLSKIESGGRRGTQLLSIERIAACLGYRLVLVPEHLETSVRAYVNSNGRTFGVQGGDSNA